MRLDKTALITGAAQGIGKAIAERLASEGARVFLSDINETKLKETALALDMPYKVADASKKADIKALVSAVLEAFGHLDIVVNNAGIIHAAELLDLEEEDFDRVLAVNLKSAFCSRRRPHGIWSRARRARSSTCPPSMPLSPYRTKSPMPFPRAP